MFSESMAIVGEPVLLVGFFRAGARLLRRGARARACVSEREREREGETESEERGETRTTTTAGMLLAARHISVKTNLDQLSCAGVDNPWTTAQEGFY